VAKNKGTSPTTTTATWCSSRASSGTSTAYVRDHPHVRLTATKEMMAAA
jgi:hypothetical protein